MDVFTFVIIIVVIGCGTGVLTEYFKTKRESEEFTGDEDLFAELERVYDICHGCRRCFSVWRGSVGTTRC